jgi:hypothetical protein
VNDEGKKGEIDEEGRRKEEKRRGRKVYGIIEGSRHNYKHTHRWPPRSMSPKAESTALGKMRTAQNKE